MIKRSLFAIFLNTTPEAENPTWSIIGKKVTDLSIAYNPQTSTEQDITQDSAETELTGYQPSFPVSQKANTSDPAYVFVNELRKSRAIGDDCKSQICIVDLYDGNATDGYSAELQDVTISIDTYGGAASDPLSIDYTVYYDGDATKGTFIPSTKKFTAAEE